MGTTVRDEVGRDPVEANNMLYKQLGGLRGSRELGEGSVKPEDRLTEAPNARQKAFQT